MISIQIAELGFSVRHWKKSAASKGNKFHSMFKFSHSSITLPSLKWSAVFPSLYEQAFKGYYFCSNVKTKWFRLFILPLPIGTVFIGLLNQTKAKTRQTERCMVCLNCPAKHGIDWMAFYPSEENQFFLHENSVEWASDPCWRPPPGLWYR